MNMIPRATALAALAVVLAGCGSSSSSSGASSSPAAYRAQVNKICATDNAKITALPKSISNSVSGLNQLLAIDRSAVAQVTAVTPPSSIRPAVQSWLDLVEQSSSNATNLVNAVKSGNKSQIQTLGAHGRQLNTQTNAKATALGLPSCAENAQPSA